MRTDSSILDFYKYNIAPSVNRDRLAHTMAESISEPVANGTEPTSLDVEMKEETLAEEVWHSSYQIRSKY